MLILASLSGIQDFLFDVREAGGGQARSLRYRSFRIQLMAECIALRLLDAAGLPWERLLFSAAGKVCLDAEGLPAATLEAVRGAAADLERRLLDETHGRLRLSIALDQSPGGFAARFERANRGLAINKARPCAPLPAGRWGDCPLVVRRVWDAEAEAARDDARGRKLAHDRWLTVHRPGDGADGSGADTLGFRVRLEAEVPVADGSVVSCSNLAEPDAAPRSVDRRFFHPRRLARHVPCDSQGNAREFVDLAAGNRGAAMLGVLKADADSLGAAVAETLRKAEGDGAAALRGLSVGLDTFFSRTLEDEKQREPWNLIYTVFSGGDDMLAVGRWDIILDFAGHMRDMFERIFGAAAANRPCASPLTISAGVAIIKPKYPIHLAARQADDLLEEAKTATAPGAGSPKDQCAALGSLWKWQDHDAVIGAGKQLADWVKRDGNPKGVIERGWLHTLLELALLRRGLAGPEYAGVHPAVATSRLAYHVARNWPQKRDHPRDDKQRAGNDARSWIDAVLREFDRFDTTTHVESLHLPATVRYAMLATRSGASEDRP
jgi:CRISPR-associated protein Csm1